MLHTSAAGITTDSATSGVADHCSTHTQRMTPHESSLEAKHKLFFQFLPDNCLDGTLRKTRMFCTTKEGITMDSTVSDATASILSIQLLSRDIVVAETVMCNCGMNYNRFYAVLRGGLYSIHAQRMSPHYTALEAVE